MKKRKKFTKAPKKLKTPRGKSKVRMVMREFKKGKLRSGNKHGPKVTNRKQAIAIALSEQRKAEKDQKPE
jgi:hypothetical protein